MNNSPFIFKGNIYCYLFVKHIYLAKGSYSQILVNASSKGNLRNVQVVALYVPKVNTAINERNKPYLELYLEMDY